MCCTRHFPYVLVTLQPALGIHILPAAATELSTVESTGFTDTLVKPVSGQVNEFILTTRDFNGNMRDTPVGPDDVSG